MADEHGSVVVPGAIFSFSFQVEKKLLRVKHFLKCCENGITSTCLPKGKLSRLPVPTSLCFSTCFPLLAFSLACVEKQKACEQSP